MRRLSLKKETLAELSGEELGEVQGGSGQTCVVCLSEVLSCNTERCLPTWDACFTTHGCA